MAVRGFVIRRVIVACLAFGVAHTVVDRTCRYAIVEWIIETGKALGGKVIEAGRIGVGLEGPFYGEGLQTWLLNAAYRHGPWIAAAAAGFACVMVAYAVCAGPLGRTRVFGHRGATRCGGCGYALKGLREMRCPECGRGI